MTKENVISSEGLGDKTGSPSISFRWNLFKRYKKTGKWDHHENPCKGRDNMWGVVIFGRCRSAATHGYKSTQRTRWLQSRKGFANSKLSFWFTTVLCHRHQLRDWKTGVKQDCIKPKGAGNGVYSMVHKVSMTGTFCRVSFYPNGANDYLMNSSADLVKTNPWTHFLWNRKNSCRAGVWAKENCFDWTSGTSHITG